MKLILNLGFAHQGNTDFKIFKKFGFALVHSHCASRSTVVIWIHPPKVRLKIYNPVQEIDQ